MKYCSHMVVGRTTTITSSEHKLKFGDCTGKVGSSADRGFSFKRPVKRLIRKPAAFEVM